MHSAEGGTFTFEDRLRNGMIKREDAISQQKKNTARVIEMKGLEEGGWKVRLDNGNETSFENLASAAEWYKRTGGLIYDDEGKLLVGRTVDEMLSDMGK